MVCAYVSICYVNPKKTWVEPPFPCQHPAIGWSIVPKNLAVGMKIFNYYHFNILRHLHTHVIASRSTGSSRIASSGKHLVNVVFLSFFNYCAWFLPVIFPLVWLIIQGFWIGQAKVIDIIHEAIFCFSARSSLLGKLMAQRNSTGATISI